MVTYSEVKDFLNGQSWDVFNGIFSPYKPSFYDKNLKYTLKYPNVIFIDINENQLIVPRSANQHLITRESFFWIHAVYDTMDNAIIAAKYLQQNMNGKAVTAGTWSMNGKARFITKQRRVIAILPFKEWKFTSYTEW